MTYNIWKCSAISKIDFLMENMQGDLNLAAGISHKFVEEQAGQ